MRKLLFLGVLALTACASPVFDPQGVDPALTPERAVARLPAVEDRRVIWGGRIIASRNLENGTELVVLGFPLSRAQRPEIQARPVGRFIALFPGYLETGIHAPDRLVTVEGRVAGLETRRVGQARYDYPVMTADAVHLWKQGRDSRSNVHFGIGIGIGIDG